jgi:hypothetical protein
MACPHLRLDVSPASPTGRYICVPTQSGTGTYQPCVAELREWCLTTACGNPRCVHRPVCPEGERRLAS